MKDHAVIRIRSPILKTTLAGIAVLFANCSGEGGTGTEEVEVVPPTATLSWDPVNAGNLSGYRVYYGTSSRTYIQSLGQGINVGDQTTFTVTGLNGRTRYYFAVTGYDSTSGYESDYSNEVFKDIR